MADDFELPPPLLGAEDEKGNITLSRREIEDLRNYLERLTKYIVDNFQSL